jgi:SAM-dependent methyltransferase
MKFEKYEEWLRFKETQSYIEALKNLRRINYLFWLFKKDLDYVKADCTNCKTFSTFMFDRQHAVKNNLGGFSKFIIKKRVNFRERLLCADCGLNQRMRTNLQVIVNLIPKKDLECIWLQEQMTPLYKILLKEYSGIVGSEYLGSKAVPGVLTNGIRHEDATDSTFESNSVDAILSFDVLEHIPNYVDAIREAYRVLKHGGLFLWTAPFNLENPETEVRANVDSNGKTIHLMEPEFHGDPVNPGVGILCYQTFGWDILKTMKEIGFNSVEIIWENNKAKGILSLDNILIQGNK